MVCSCHKCKSIVHWSKLSVVGCVLTGRGFPTAKSYTVWSPERFQKTLEMATANPIKLGTSSHQDPEYKLLEISWRFLPLYAWGALVLATEDVATQVSEKKKQQPRQSDKNCSKQNGLIICIVCKNCWGEMNSLIIVPGNGEKKVNSFCLIWKRLKKNFSCYGVCWFGLSTLSIGQSTTNIFLDLLGYLANLVGWWKASIERFSETDQNNKLLVDCHFNPSQLSQQGTCAITEAVAMYMRVRGRQEAAVEI